jgi:uncharacterized iron-regulated protein
MHPFHRTIIACALLIVTCISAHGAPFARVRDGKPADLAEVVQDIAGADVIFIGETHDNAQLHATALAIIRSLHARKLPLALGLEMFTPEDQQALDDWTAGKLDEEKFIPIYSRNWSYGWQLYRDLFLFARDNHIPLIALNIPKPVIARVMARGPAALQASEIPPKVSWTLNESQSVYMKTIARQVFGNTPPDRLVERLCAAQAFRNSGMAWNIVNYRKKHDADKVVVLAGTWHAVKNGVPELLPAYGVLTYRVILPELPEFNLGNATAREADYLITR